MTHDDNTERPPPPDALTLVALHAQMTALTERVEALEAQRAAAEPTDAAYAHLAVEIHAYIASVWNELRVPVPVSALSRQYSRRAKAFGGLYAIVKRMEIDGHVSTLRTLTFALNVFPRQVYEALSPDEREAYRRNGIPDRVVARMSRLYRETLVAQAGKMPGEVLDPDDGHEPKGAKS